MCVRVRQLLVREPLLAGDVSEYLAGAHFFFSEGSFFLPPSLSHIFFFVLERLPHIRMSENQGQTAAPHQQQDDGRSAMRVCVCVNRERDSARARAHTHTHTHIHTRARAHAHSHP